MMGENTIYGHRSTVACRVVGLTYRQLDYWTRTGLVAASGREADGSGSQRLYTFGDLVLMATIKMLVQSGVGLRKVRRVVADGIDWEKPDEYTAILIGRNRHTVVRSYDAVVEFLKADEVMVAVSPAATGQRVRAAVAEFYDKLDMGWKPGERIEA